MFSNQNDYPRHYNALKRNINEVYNNIENIYDTQASTHQHCLLQLSCRDVERNRNNIVFLSELTLVNNKCCYGLIKYGKNINNKGSRVKGQKKNSFRFMVNLDRFLIIIIVNNKLDWHYIVLKVYYILLKDTIELFLVN